VHAPTSRCTTSLDDLRLLHGACSNAAATDLDALCSANGLIALHADDATRRPHLFMLSGEQIYADTWATRCSSAVSDAAKVLRAGERS